MSKTAEDILEEKLAIHLKAHLPESWAKTDAAVMVRRNPFMLEAMHTYAQVVLKWVSENCTYNSELMMWGYKDDLYNYEQLIELFTHQNQK